MKIRIFFSLVVLLGIFNAQAGIRFVKVGINGLTCSMCSRTVEKSMLRLSFVERVEMSLEATEAVIFIKPQASVSMKEIARSVKDAGFSVRSVEADLDFSDLRLADDGTFFCQGQQYSWLGKRTLHADGKVKLKLIDTGFIPPNEKSKWASLLTGLEKTTALHVVRE